MNTLLPTRLKFPAKARKEIVTRLNAHLADLLDLQSQARHAHWNVRGRLFHGLHQTFDEVAALAGANLDELAERIATLGGTAHGTVRDAAKNSRLSNYTADPADELGRVSGLADQVATSAAAVRADIETAASLGDPGTADLLTEISQALDKGLWLLEAHLTAPSAQG